MWSRSYSKTFKNIKKEEVWRLWTDVSKRHTWHLLTTAIQISGPLSFIWRKLVAEGSVKTLPEQTEALVKLARKKNV